MSSERKKIYRFFTRKEIGNGNVSFDDILLEAIEVCLGKIGLVRDNYFDANVGRLWNYLLQEQENQHNLNGINPIFKVVNSTSRTICCYVSEKFSVSNDRKYYLLKSRPYLLNEIDLLNPREYEALAAFVCKLLGANNILLTPSGNEAGIDFVATIKFHENSHYLLGSNGPIRIIGQCKKYSSAVQVDKIKEFTTTLNEVHNLHQKVRKVLPSWFSQAKGPILGWVISHSGFQQGAKDKGKEYGLILSETRDLGEIIAASKKYYVNVPINTRHNFLRNEVSLYL
jgi:hypothetical protein